MRDLLNLATLTRGQKFSGRNGLANRRSSVGHLHIAQSCRCLSSISSENSFIIAVHIRLIRRLPQWKTALTLLQPSGNSPLLGDAGVTQLVECNLAKVDVEGSNPFARSTPYNKGVMENKDPGWGKVLPKVLPCFLVLRMYCNVIRETSSKVLQKLLA